MNKAEFLQQLRQRLAHLPASERERFLSYYGEMIDDRLEDGMSEAEAVEGLGSLSQIVESIQYETPMTSLMVASVKDRTKQAQAKAERRWPGWGTALVIVLLIVGAPLWLSLALALIGGLLGLVAAIVGVIAAIAAAFITVTLAALAGLLLGLILLIPEPAVGCALLGCGLVLGGLSVFAYFLGLICVKGLYQLLRLLIHWVKGWFVKKEAAYE